MAKVQDFNFKEYSFTLMLTYVGHDKHSARKSIIEILLNPLFSKILTYSNGVNGSQPLNDFKIVSSINFSNLIKCRKNHFSCTQNGNTA